MAVSSADEHHREACEVPRRLERRNAVTKRLGYRRFCNLRSISGEYGVSVGERTLPWFLRLGTLRKRVDVPQ